MTKNRSAARYCTLQIADNNQRLLICSCGLMITKANAATRCCPSCGQIPEVRLVDCADPDHNSPGGCRNPDCWKHPKAKDTSCTSV